jgi:hypothetical protein
MALAGWFLERSEKNTGLFAIPLYFTLANLASLVGFIKFLSGKRYARWEPIRERRTPGKFTEKRENLAMNLKSTTRDNNLIYDVGMHKGQDTDFYLKKGFKVVAFEANPENINFCKRRFAEAIKDKRLTIVEGAIVENAARTGQETVRFYLNKNHSFWGSTCDDWAYRNEVMGYD